MKGRGLFCSFAVGMSLFSAEAGTPASPPTNQVQISQTYGQMPLHFEINEGQADSSAKYLARGGGYSMYLTEKGVLLALSSPTEVTAKHTHQSLKQSGRQSLLMM